MKTVRETIEKRDVHSIKAQRLLKEFSWIAREFRNFHTTADLELDNVERYVELHLG